MKFENDDILVTSEIMNSFKAPLVVTFSSWSSPQIKERVGFARDYLIKKEVNAIHFVAKSNHWFQCDCMLDLLALVRKFINRINTSSIITYGSSMGGYAALAFGHHLGSLYNICISPQFSINPEIPPYDKRWSADFKNIEFILPINLSVLADTDIVIYDPKNPDLYQIECLAKGVTRLAFPYSGHPSGSVLNAMGFLDKIINLVLSNSSKLNVLKALKEIENTYLPVAEYNSLFQLNKAEHLLQANEVLKAHKVMSNIDQPMQRFSERKATLEIEILYKLGFFEKCFNKISLQLKVTKRLKLVLIGKDCLLEMKNQQDAIDFMEAFCCQYGNNTLFIREYKSLINNK
jgi:hypothetical protein